VTGSWPPENPVAGIGVKVAVSGRPSMVHSTSSPVRTTRLMKLLKATGGDVGRAQRIACEELLGRRNHHHEWICRDSIGLGSLGVLHEDRRTRGLDLMGAARGQIEFHELGTVDGLL
jgi:hypothetical protein